MDRPPYTNEQICSALCHFGKAHNWIPTKHVVDIRWFIMPGYGGQGVNEEKDRRIRQWLDGQTCVRCRCCALKYDD